MTKIKINGQELTEKEVLIIKELIQNQIDHDTLTFSEAYLEDKGINVDERNEIANNLQEIL